MVHLVYKIINKLNGHYYIGVHSTLDIDDGYMGSGTLMRRAIRKYGAGNFRREILFIYESREEAFIKEAELVNVDTLKDPNCYNLVLGGKGAKSRPLYSVKADQIAAYPKDSPAFDHYFEYEVKLLTPVKVVDTNLTGFGKAFFDYIASDKILEVITRLYNRIDGNILANKYISLLERLPAFQNNIAIYRYPKTTLVKNSYA
jgi:hypothetical protein